MGVPYTDLQLLGVFKNNREALVLASIINSTYPQHRSLCLGIEPFKQALWKGFRVHIRIIVSSLFFLSYSCVWKC